MSAQPWHCPSINCGLKLPTASRKVDPEETEVVSMRDLRALPTGNGALELVRNSIKLKVSLTLSAVALLAACGGGGGSTSNIPMVDENPMDGDNLGASYTPLGEEDDIFGDGAGVARGTANDGSQALIITPQVKAVVENASTASQIDDLQLSDLPIVQRLETNANLRRGAFRTDGITFNVLAVEDLEGEAVIIQAEVPNVTNFLGVEGSQYGAAPTGTFTYNGTIAMGRRVGNASTDFGSFSMSADFSNQEFTYRGDTTSNSVTGSGFLNTTTGRFTTDTPTGTLTITTSGVPRPGTMHGQTHGSSAQSVSGVFHTNEINPLYSGAFVGSR